MTINEATKEQLFDYAAYVEGCLRRADYCFIYNFTDWIIQCIKSDQKKDEQAQRIIKEQLSPGEAFMESGFESWGEFYNYCLRDRRWKSKALKIKHRDKLICQHCKAKGRNSRPRIELHVHHIEYLPLHYPWDYPDELLITLCSRCHKDKQTKYITTYQKEVFIYDPEIAKALE